MFKEDISNAFNNLYFEELLTEPMDQGDSDDEQGQPQCNPSNVRSNSTCDVNAISKISNIQI